MSFSKPKTCCIVGLFQGSSAVHKNATRRLSTISLTTESPPSRSLSSRTLTPYPSLTAFLAATTFSAVLSFPVRSSISAAPKQYTSASMPPFGFGSGRNPKSEIRGSKSSASRMLEVTRWPCTTGFERAW